MILELNNLNLKINYTETDLKNKCLKKLNAKQNQLIKIHKLKESIDARKKDDVHFVLNVAVELKNDYKNKLKLKETKIDYSGLKYKKITHDKKPIVIGFGPSGMFAGLALSKMGLCPLVFEQGKNVDERKKDIENFWQNGKLNQNSNVQFGEGGAGTFSDGKLNTNINSEINRKILNEFILAGAPKEIFYKSKPHIGSDNLAIVVKNIREEIIKNGGNVIFEHKFIDFIIKNNKICGAKILNLKNDEIINIETDHLILAIGHSAIDTFKVLEKNKIEMQPKPFAIGVRIEQSQEKINQSQYGNFAKYLPSADYKLVTHLENGRSVFTFCMCPGGQVIASSSEPETIVTNGMSDFARNLENANSAVLVNVTPNDFYKGNILDGFEYQRKYEKLAFELGGKDYSAPIQNVEDFLNNNIDENKNFEKICEKSEKNALFCEKNAIFDEKIENFEKTHFSVKPTYQPKTRYCNIENCLPDFVSESLRIALPILNQKIDGFADSNCILTAIETRTSCPVQIVRSKDGQASIQGLYPIGEGAGFAGGIMTSAIDGIRCAEKIYDSLV